MTTNEPRIPSVDDELATLTTLVRGEELAPREWEAVMKGKLAPEAAAKVREGHDSPEQIAVDGALFAPLSSEREAALLQRILGSAPAVAAGEDQAPRQRAGDGGPVALPASVPTDGGPPVQFMPRGRRGQTAIVGIVLASAAGLALMLAMPPPATDGPEIPGYAMTVGNGFTGTLGMPTDGPKRFLVGETVKLALTPERAHETPVALEVWSRGPNGVRQLACDMQVAPSGVGTLACKADGPPGMYTLQAFLRRTRARFGLRPIGNAVTIEVERQ
jgi:hypothetical protein